MNREEAVASEAQGEETRQIQRIAFYGFLLNLGLTAMKAEVKSVVGRNAGRFRFIQASIAMRTGDLQKAHRISEEVESNIRERIPHVERVAIHYEPQTREYLRIAVPLSDSGGKIASHFGDAPYFGVVLLRLSDHRIEKQEIVENPHRTLEKAKGIRVAEWLIAKKVDEVALVEEVEHKGPGYVFSDAGVKIHVVSARDLGEALDAVVAKNRSMSTSQ
jgi:predicted Fe-Mo cluster-binding NifX family protein